MNIQAERAIRRTSIPDAVADDLRRRILAGEIGEGEQLRQESLAATYAVSRMPVREALRRLEAEGLVTLSHHRGATVTPLAPDEIRELFDLRELIEPDLLRRAVARLAPADLARARAAARRFDAALASPGALGPILQDNWDLHAALYQPAGRPRTIRLLRTLHEQAERYTRLHIVLNDARERSSIEHRRLIELCAAREADAACALLVRHIHGAGRDLAGALGRRRLAVEEPA